MAYLLADADTRSSDLFSRIDRLPLQLSEFSDALARESQALVWKDSSDVKERCAGFASIVPTIML